MFNKRYFFMFVTIEDDKRSVITQYTEKKTSFRITHTKKYFYRKWSNVSVACMAMKSIGTWERNTTPNLHSSLTNAYHQF